MTDREIYQREYRQWVASLSPKQRAKLKAQGLDKPMADDFTSFKPDPELSLASITTDFDYDQLDEPEKLDNGALETKAKAYGAQLLIWVFQRIQSHGNERMAALDKECLLFALGLENLLNVKTQTALGEKYGITRACVSARVKSWQKLLGMKPSSMMKSDSACRSYRRARIANLTRKVDV